MGEWETPITSELITSQSISLGAPVIAPDGHLYWLEGRPTEGGRQVLVRRHAGSSLAQPLTANPVIVGMSLVPCLMLLMMHKLHVHQPWRLDRCHSLTHCACQLIRSLCGAAGPGRLPG